ncbi:IclR family transcriptional regulator [Paraburkholderia agricolaris]|uniref:IclR family transcriptional regulator n=1 Tax=Paraburkholderia agricolaris TaxID=2152888 RepID=UPI0012927074|nr:IclR family transcriptional regulator [Paraburkholderia agricolaris]
MVRKSSMLTEMMESPQGERAPAPNEDKAFVNVVAKAFELLFAFDGTQSRLGNQDIARITGLPKATVARLTYTMTRLGYLSYLPDESKYKIGERAIALSGSIFRGLDFRLTVRPYMKELADFSSASCSIGIYDGESIVYIEHVQSDEPLALRHSVGSRIPVLKTAAGHAYIAAISEEARAELFAELETRDEPGWPEMLPEVQRDIKSYQKSGYVVSCGKWIPNLNGVAVAVWSPRHATHFIFSVGGLSHLVTPARLKDDIAPRLVDLVHKVAGILTAADEDALGIRAR